MEPGGSFRFRKSPPLVPNLCQINSVHVPHPPIPLHEDPFLYLSSLLLLGIPRGLFPSGSPTKALYAPHLSPM